jgi:hypothetical protein
MPSSLENLACDGHTVTQELTSPGSLLPQLFTSGVFRDLLTV